MPIERALELGVLVYKLSGVERFFGNLGNQHMPGEEVWLVGEQRTSGGRKFYLSNLAAGTSLRARAVAIKARWICEQAHQQPKEELGLDLKLTRFRGRPEA